MPDLNVMVREFIDWTKSNEFESLGSVEQNKARNYFFENYIEKEKGNTNKSYSDLSMNNPEEADAIKRIILTPLETDVGVEEPISTIQTDRYSPDPNILRKQYEQDEKERLTSVEEDYQEPITAYDRDEATEGMVGRDFPRGVDVDTGAINVDTGKTDYNIRNLQGNLPGNELQKLEVLKQFFPNVRIGRNEQGGFEGFEFINPNTGLWTRMNPAGMDLGDVVQYGKEIAGMIGQGTGAIGGGIVGSTIPGVGTTAGAIAGGGVGNAAAKEAYRLATRVFGAGTEDPRTLSETGKDVLFDVAEGSFWQGTSPYIGKFISRQGRMILGGGKSAAQNLRNAIQDLNVIGKDAVSTLGTLSQKPVMRFWEMLSSSMIGGKGRFAKMVRKSNLQIQDKVNEIADGISKVKGRVDPSFVGRKMKEGLEEGVNRAKSKLNKRFSEFNEWFLNEDQFPVSNFLHQLKKFVNPEELKGLEVGKILTSNTLGSVNETIRRDIARRAVTIINRNMKIDPITFADEGLGAFEKVTGKAGLNKALQTENFEGLAGLNFQAIRRLRGMIGDRLTNANLIDDASRGEYKKLWGALTQDLEKIAASKGDDVLQKFRKVNADYAKLIDDVSNVIDNISKNFEPSKVFEAFERNAQGEALEYLKTVSKNLTKEEFDIVAGSIVRKLGKPTATQIEAKGAFQDTLNFNFFNFGKNFNKLSPEIKKVLFKNNPQHLKDLEAISRHASRVRAGMDNFLNPSGTADKMTAIGGVQLGVVGTLANFFAGKGISNLGLFLSAMTTWTGMGNVSARYLTNPGIARWLAKGAETKFQGRKAWAAWLSGGLKAMDNIEDLEDYGEILKFIGGLTSAEASTGTPQTTEGYGRKMQQMRGRLLSEVGKKRPSTRRVQEGMKREKERETLESTAGALGFGRRF